MTSFWSICFLFLSSSARRKSIILTTSRRLQFLLIITNSYKSGIVSWQDFSLNPRRPWEWKVAWQTGLPAEMPLEFPSEAWVFLRKLHKITVRKVDQMKSIRKAAFFLLLLCFLKISFYQIFNAILNRPHTFLGCFPHMLKVTLASTSIFFRETWFFKST